MAARSSAKKLDLNTAPAEALAQVPGLDAELAVRVIALRPYKHIKELLRVPGLEFEAFQQATAHVKVARAGASQPARAAKPRARRTAARAAPAPEPPPAVAPAPPPVQVHVHVNAGPAGETTTYRTTTSAAPPLPLPEPIIIADPQPVRPASQSLTPRPTTAVMPLPRQVSAALFESYAGPRVVFTLFSCTLLALALAFTTGRLRWSAASPPSTPAATLDSPATAISQAVAATLAAQTPTPAPTATPLSPTATAPAPLPSPTSGLGASSGLDHLGRQIFNETFTPANYWSVGETDFSHFFIEGGWLRAVIKTPGSIAWAVNGYSGDDFYYQALMQIGACQLGDYAGLAFRIKDDYDFYFFGLACDGRFRLVQRNQGDYQFPVDFTFSPEAAAGSGATNLLAVRAQGRQASLYINDQLVKIVTDLTPGKGWFGVFAKSGNTANLQASFDDASAWELTP